MKFSTTSCGRFFASISLIIISVAPYSASALASPSFQNETSHAPVNHALKVPIFCTKEVHVARFPNLLLHVPVRCSSIPAPTLNFSASTSTIPLGATTTISWVSTDASSCTASLGWSGNKALSGSAVVSPTTTTPYSLTCTGQGGGNVTKQLTITIASQNILHPALTISASSNPQSQTFVASTTGYLFANYRLDTTSSDEDVKLQSLQVYEVGTAPVGSLSNCEALNGASSLNTGTNILNSVVAGQNTLSFDTPLIVTKGTVLTLAFRCNVSSFAPPGTNFIFGVSTLGSSASAAGVTSSTSFAPTITNSASGVMTVANSAQVNVQIDSSSPAYAVAAGGTTGVTVSVIKLRSTNEALNLTKLGLTLANGIYGALSTGASGSPSGGAGDLVQVYLYSGSTLLGTATFTASNTTATSTFFSPFNIARDTDTTLKVKADLTNIGVAQSGGIGNLIKVDPLNAEGIGATSGITIKTNSTAGVAGNRLFKTFPSIALDTLPSTGIQDGRLMHFKITANSMGPVGIAQFAFAISTSTATTTSFQLFAFTDSSYSQAVSGQGTGGQVGITSPGEPATRGLTLVHIIGIKYTDFFTDGTTTFSFPGDPAIDSKLNQPNAQIPTHPGLTWVQTTTGVLYDTPSGDLEVGDYVVQSDGSIVTNAPVSTDGVREIFTPIFPVEIPAGTTYYFELRASVAPGATVIAKMLGDSAYGTTFTDGYNAQTVAQVGTKNAKNFIWTGNSTTTSQTADIDWSDGFGLPGLPASGLVMTRTN